LRAPQPAPQVGPTRDYAKQPPETPKDLKSIPHFSNEEEEEQAFWESENPSDYLRRSKAIRATFLNLKPTPEAELGGRRRTARVRGEVTRRAVHRQQRRDLVELSA